MTITMLQRNHKCQPIFQLLFLTLLQIRSVFRRLLLTLVAEVSPTLRSWFSAEVHFKWTFYCFSPVTNQRFKNYMCQQPAVLTIKLQDVEAWCEIKIISSLSQLLHYQIKNDYVYELTQKMNVYKDSKRKKDLHK